MFFISENGAVIYRGKDLYNYRSFNQVEYKEVVDYLNIDRNIKRVYSLRIKECLYIERHE